MSEFSNNIGEAIAALAQAIDAVDRATRTANGLEQLAAAPLSEMIEHCKIDAETLRRASEEAERRAEKSNELRKLAGYAAFDWETQTVKNFWAGTQHQEECGRWCSMNKCQTIPLYIMR